MGKKKDYSGSGQSFESPFAALLKDVAVENQGRAAVEEQPPTEIAGESEDGMNPLKGARLHLHMSRKGRGGKTTTTIGGFLSADALGPLAKDIGKSLGCGAFVEEDVIIVQGDQRERLKSLLLKKGAKGVG